MKAKILINGKPTIISWDDFLLMVVLRMTPDNPIEVLDAGYGLG